MDEFPDPDEEFDLVEPEVHKSPEKSSAKNDVHAKVNEDPAQELLETSTVANDTLPSTQSKSYKNGTAVSVETTRKRTYEELLRDFEDLFEGETIMADDPIGRDKRPRWTEPEAVIELILKERGRQHSKVDDTAKLANSCVVGSSNDWISTKVPAWNFIALTRPSDSQRIYLRIQEKKNQLPTRSERPIGGLLGVPYSQLKAEAEEIMLKNAKRARCPPPRTSSKKCDDQLWVDKYRPRSYSELLSDETVNRNFLSWIKLWDKVVFNREVPKRKKIAPAPIFGNKKFVRKNEVEGLDAHGFPTHRIALLSGAPGLGKTTMAHMIAKHAGYNVVELNASDDRGPDAFRQALLASTEMRSLMGSDPRPNCLVLDEVDGAPATSVDLLIKFVQGKLEAKGKKKKSKAESGGKKSEGCKRPVICICNELYTPSLRALRAMAFVLTVPKVSASRLANRLATIARKEKLKTDEAALYQLVERSDCDIRSCLCALQYMGEACDDSSYQLGLKDAKRGLFDCWRDILQVPMDRGGQLPIRERVQIVLKAAHSGETDRLAQGIFENYQQCAPSKLEAIAEPLEWFPLFDEITTMVMSLQDWRIMPYVSYAFVAWHFGFARNLPVKISYPYASIEANQNLNKNVAMLTATKRTCNFDIETLVLDIAPLLFELLTPKLRTVPGHLSSEKERDDLNRLINVMITLGLSFVQTKTDEGAYDCVLDPNLFEIGIFPACKVRRPMPYAVKQIVAQELELERIKRSGATESKEPSSKEASATQEPPQKIETKEIKEVQVNKPNKYRNYFENFKIEKAAAPTSQQKSPGTSPRSAKSTQRMRQVLTMYSFWYKYKEGFSNSVRRDVKIADLL